VADDLRADLDQFLAQAGQRPRLRGLWHRQGSHEIAEIVGQRIILDDVQDEETSAAVKARAEQIWDIVISYRRERRETYV
jgi:hypothetical protein